MRKKNLTTSYRDYWLEYSTLSGWSEGFSFGTVVILFLIFDLTLFDR